MTDPAAPKRAALEVLALVPGLSFAMALVIACGEIAPVGNDPVPLSPDLAARLEDSLASRDHRLTAADGAVPRIAPTTALEIAGKELVAEQQGNNVPPQDPSIPSGLVRRMIVGLDGRPPTSVWVVVYRWAPGFDCHSDAGGPGPCSITSVYYVDDRTGEVVHS